MDAAGIGGAAIGAVFGELLALVIDVGKTTYHFKSKLELIQETLISLQPNIDSIVESNRDLRRADGETAKFVSQLEAGKKLVLKCSTIKPWDLVRKYKYSTKLNDFRDSLLWFCQVDLQVQLVSEVKKMSVMEKDTTKLSILKNGGGRGYCDVPGLPDLIVGLDKPLKELKTMLLKTGVSVVVVSAPGGCGKTTLTKMLCKDKEIEDIYRKSIFFVTVSKTASLKDIIQKIFQHVDLSPPKSQNEEDAINQLEILMRRLVEGGPLLLVLDDVWSEWESLIQKFDFRIDKYKILVTSRFVFPRFDYTYKLNILNEKDATTLFRHSALRKDDSCKIPDELLKKIVKGCKGFPLALIVVGRSLYGRPVVNWKSTLKKWSEGQSIFDSNKDDLLKRLQTSIDAMDESPVVKDCYLDLGSFPEDEKILASVLMDMWVEMYGLDEEGIDVLANLLELSFRNLVNLLPARQGMIEVDGYCKEHHVMQHDLLRELAIYQSSQESIEQKKRLIMDTSVNSHPQWWAGQQQQPIHVRLLSISTDETFTSSWFNVQLPSTEVLILNFRSKIYSLPQFMEKMDKLKVLIVTNYGFSSVELKNFLVLGYLSNLKRIRLEHVSIPSSLNASLLQLKNLQKISLKMCEIGEALESCTIEIPNILPNLVELEIDYCDDLVEFPIGLCNLNRLKKLSVTYCTDLIAIPDGFGRLVNLEVLRIHSCANLNELPESICGLQKLSFLDISDCVGLTKLPERIGDLQGLRALHMRGCGGIEDLPQSVEDLSELKDVICDDKISDCWKFYENQLTNLKVNVIREDINFDWLQNVV